jgi:hypothetical protein
MLHYVHVRHIESVLGPAPLPHDARQPHSPDDVQENDEQGQNRLASAPTQEFLWCRDGAGVDGLAPKETTEFIGQCLRGLVTARWFLLQALERYRLQIPWD